MTDKNWRLLTTEEKIAIIEDVLRGYPDDHIDKKKTLVQIAEMRRRDGNKNLKKGR